MLDILAKDDCFTYFLISSFTKLGIKVNVLCSEPQTPTRLIMQYLEGKKIDDDVLNKVVKTRCVTNSIQKNYFSTKIINANLVIIGSFSDLVLKTYRRKKYGWEFFELKENINQSIIFNYCERVPLTPPKEFINNTKKLFNVYKKNNPRAKKVFINYPYLDGANIEWDNDFIENRVVKSRWEEFTKLANEQLPRLGVYVLNLDPSKVEVREDKQLWHYTDATYDYAADKLIKDVLYDLT